MFVNDLSSSDLIEEGKCPSCARALLQTFDEAGLCESLRKNVTKSGYVKPTPVQKHGIPIISAGRDLMACAQTGSGKTARTTLYDMLVLLNANLWFCCGLSVMVITCILAVCHHTGGLPAAHPTAADGWWSGSQQVQWGAGARGHNRGPHQRAHQSDLSGGQEVCIWVRILV